MVPLLGLNDEFAPGFAPYFPTAKIGQGNYIFVWSGGVNGGNATNYFSPSVPVFASGGLSSTAGLTVQQAYAIDTKIDDGLPQTGSVTTMWPGTASFTGAWIGASPGTATTGSSTTCYDNRGVAANSMQYSVEISNGANVNCALSFRFQ